MRRTVIIALSCILLAATVSFLGPATEADSLPPEITNTIRSQKYPVEGENVTFNATVVDNDNITAVYLVVCYGFTCDNRPMTDPDGDSVYGAEYEMPFGESWADSQIQALDEFFNMNETPPEYFPIVHWINLTATVDPAFPVINDPFWVNGTSIYDDNMSAPAEQSLVQLEILETGENWTTQVEAARAEVMNVVNNFFYERLTALPSIKLYIDGMQEHKE